ncbi:MAG: MGMT family protein [Opitutaceae bacterium]|nr:MGMT family protein [Opitutaceae bacterium]
MAAKKKTWREKLADSKDLPKVVPIPPAGRKRWGGATLAIPAPRDVDALMRTVPKGRVTTINELRAVIAKKHRAAAGCPITTGIFSWIAAQAAEEALTAGERAPTPYWRTLKKGGELNPKYPGGTAALERKLAAEGHTFVRKGARVLVANLEQVLYSPTAR